MNYRITPLLMSGLLLFPGSISMAADEVPDRSTIPFEHKWDLSHLYLSDQAWEEAVGQTPKMIEGVQKYKGTLGDSAETILECFQARDDLNRNLSRIYAYARMHLDTDQTNGQYQTMQGKAQSVLSEAGAAASFIEPELLTLPEDVLEEYTMDPRFKDYKVYLQELLRQKAHLLSPAEEKILAATSTIGAAPQNIFGALSYGDMKFPSVSNDKGEAFVLSEGRFGTLVKSPDRKVRKEAFETLLTTYSQYRTTYAALLSSSVQKDHFYSSQRKYESDLDGALSPNLIPTSVYHNLVDRVNDRLPLLHRYMGIKKKAMGLEELHLYDLYVPIQENPFGPFSYDQGVQVMMAGLAPLGEEYVGDLKKGMTSGWIDRYENKGKRSGAYSWGVYGAHPFVLLNYQNKLDDVLTLSHEMGHAMHSYYSQKYQPYSNSDYTIFCAEVASTTNEALVLRHLLKNAKTKEERIFLLTQMAESIRTTLYRQTLFAEFEIYIHGVVQEKGSITADDMEVKWVELYKKYYGSDVVIDEVVKSEWSRIPHFYRDFYVYQYATGISAAWAFADQIEQKGDAGRDAYLKFLQSGSSEDSITILKNAGVDMSTPAPIEATLKQFEWVLDELEKELGK